MIIIFIWMFLALSGSSQSATFQCKYIAGDWSILGKIYYCDVQNAVNITSLDAAQVDSITGTHLAGYNNDNVVAIQILIKGQIHYFLRGINKIFKNLKGIRMEPNGMKELHQSDLKSLPKLVVLWLYGNNLEIVEENLFEFNLNLEFISFNTNKISHIDPTVFDKLTKLRYLYLASNICINMGASNSTEVQNVIKTAKVQCINSDYLYLEQKVKNLEFESIFLNSADLYQKVEDLETKVKNSNFQNTFLRRLQDLKITLIEKKKNEDKFFDRISGLIKINSNEMCSALESKVDDLDNKLLVQGTIEEKMTSISDAIEMINKNYEEMNRRFERLENSLSACH